MRTVTPTLYVIARPALVHEEIKRFLDDEDTTWRVTEGASEAELSVELGGRICYFSFGDAQSPKSTGEYITNLIDRGHTSVLEHAVWSFILTGVSRAFTHQFVRHRVGFSFSQLSQQYHDESDVEFIKPSIVEQDDALSERWDRTIGSLREMYREIERGIVDGADRETRRAVRSAARSVLPAATETKIAFTANARALRLFLETRGSIPGDEEMRFVSAAILGAMRHEAPALFADFEMETLSDGSPIVVKRVS